MTSMVTPPVMDGQPASGLTVPQPHGLLGNIFLQIMRNRAARGLPTPLADRRGWDVGQIHAPTAGQVPAPPAAAAPTAPQAAPQPMGASLGQLFSGYGY